MTEMGAPATTGLNYGASSTNVNISFIRGICSEVNSLGLGMAYWPSHRAGDTFRLFNSPGDGVTNPSLIDQLQSGWGFFSSLASLEVADFNVAGTTDYSTFRPAGSIWEIQGGGGGQFGLAGDIAVPADYVGNGKAQMAVWRQSTGEYWYIDGGATTQFGLAGDIPVPGDYLGTGKAQIAVWRPAGGNWYVNGGTTTQFGLNGDIPVPGYYNGDGHLDMAVYRPSTKTWYINGGATVQWGLAGDIPVPGDYNGSGLTQIAVWRPSNGTWYVDGVSTIAWGTNGDIPLPLPYAIRHYCLGYSQ